MFLVYLLDFLRQLVSQTVFCGINKIITKPDFLACRRELITLSFMLRIKPTSVHPGSGNNFAHCGVISGVLIAVEDNYKNTISCKFGVNFALKRTRVEQLLRI